jgi:ethanolamine-phosphate phospho-lyase
VALAASETRAGCVLQALALAYVCMNKSDPLAVAVEVTASYHATNPLSEEEVDMIWTMIGARNVQSVANSAHSYKLEPDNEYLLLSAAPAWGLMRQSDEIDVRDANNALRKACAMDAADAAGSL